MHVPVVVASWPFSYIYSWTINCTVTAYINVVSFCLLTLDCTTKNCTNGGTQDPISCDCVCAPDYTGLDCGSESGPTHNSV